MKAEHEKMIKKNGEYILQTNEFNQKLIESQRLSDTENKDWRINLFKVNPALNDPEKSKIESKQSIGIDPPPIPDWMKKKVK